MYRLSGEDKLVVFSLHYRHIFLIYTVYVRLLGSFEDHLISKSDLEMS